MSWNVRSVKKGDGDGGFEIASSSRQGPAVGLSTKAREHLSTNKQTLSSKILFPGPSLETCQIHGIYEPQIAGMY